MAPTVLDKVFEVIEQGIIVVNERGIVAECNRRAAQLMGDMECLDDIKIGCDILDCIPAAENLRRDCFPIDELPTEIKSRQSNRYVSLVCHKLESARRRWSAM